MLLAVLGARVSLEFTDRTRLCRCIHCTREHNVTRREIGFVASLLSEAVCRELCLHGDRYSEQTKELAIELIEFEDHHI